MEKVNKLFINFERAYHNLYNSIPTANTELELDGIIRRFELCYEFAWRLIQGYLAYQGIICNTPRTCLKYAVDNDLINNQESWVRMKEDLHRLAHTYTSAASMTIFESIKNQYLESFTFLYGSMKEAGL